MTHLATEVLARLVDESPSPDEETHLRACPDCAAERDALVEQTRALAGLGPISPSDRAWDRLHTELRSAGLVRAPSPSRDWMRTSLRAAAVVAALLGGGALLSIRDPAGPAPRQVSIRQAPPTALSPALSQEATRPRPSEAVSASRSEAVPDPDASTAGTPPRPVPEVTRLAPRALRNADAEETIRTLSEDEAAAMDALASYVRATMPSDDTDPLARLAAWEGVVLATGDAVERAPASPVANGYHLLALEQRDAVLRQVTVATEPWY